MFGCESAATALASRSNRARRSAILRERSGEHLDRHIAIETRVLRLVDFAHAAGTEGGDDLVGTDAVAGVQCQVGQTAAILARIHANGRAGWQRSVHVHARRQSDHFSFSSPCDLFSTTFIVWDSAERIAPRCLPLYLVGNSAGEASVRRQNVARASDTVARDSGVVISSTRRLLSPATGTAWIAHVFRTRHTCPVAVRRARSATGCRTNAPPDSRPPTIRRARARSTGQAPDLGTLSPRGISNHCPVSSGSSPRASNDCTEVSTACATLRIRVAKPRTHVAKPVYKPLVTSFVTLQGR